MQGLLIMLEQPKNGRASSRVPFVLSHRFSVCLWSMARKDQRSMRTMSFIISKKTYEGLMIRLPHRAACLGFPGPKPFQKTPRYCWSTSFKVLEVLYHGEVSSAF